jgi:hypothetical protein
MDYYYTICDDVLCKVDEYYDSVKVFEKYNDKDNTWYSSTNLYTYYEIPERTIKKHDLYYDSINITKSKTNNTYISTLQQFSLIDLHRILYLLLINVTSKFVIGKQHESNGSHSADISAPYEAINGAIQLIEYDMKILGNDELKNNIDMVNKYNMLEKQHKELQEKYECIKKIIT